MNNKILKRYLEIETYQINHPRIASIGSILLAFIAGFKPDNTPVRRLKIIAKKNIVLNEKIDVLSKRTIRNRLLSFLQIQSQKNDSNHFSIPFNRKELADYLCVDRSALSNEMSKLQNEGFFSVSKNEFTIYSSKGNK